MITRLFFMKKSHIAAGIIAVGIISSALASNAGAQDTSAVRRTMTLKECTEYAIENNCELLQDKIDVKNAATDLKTAKAARYPSVSASAGQNYSGNWFNNSTEHKNSYSGSYGVSAGIVLYNGGKLKRDIEEKETTLKIQNLSVSKNGLDLKVSIAQYYIQVLYDIENIKITKEAMEASKVQWSRGKEFMKAGNMSKADCAKLEAQYNSDKYNYTAANSTFETDLLALKSAMELQRSDVGISIPEIAESAVLEAIPDKNSAYEKALVIRPEIEMSNLYIKNSETALKSAKGGYYPTVSLSASSGTNNISGTGTNFGRQLKTNWSNAAGITISIPIYSNRSNKSAVEKAQNNIDYYKLAAEIAEDELYTTVANLYLNARNSQQEYISAKESYRSASESYKLVCEQFDLGMKNIVELEQEKSTYISAELSYAQSKYKALLNVQILKFYTGSEITI